mmetsp:Transcript_112240/g.318226  ORF Transcript_112240/g.318226 Transcript_112240/m.318226 type:complete len:445 (-) Transcript_112240:418-1752(-)
MQRDEPLGAALLAPLAPPFDLVGHSHEELVPWRTVVVGALVLGAEVAALREHSHELALVEVAPVLRVEQQPPGPRDGAALRAQPREELLPRGPAPARRGPGPARGAPQLVLLGRDVRRSRQPRPLQLLPEQGLPPLRVLSEQAGQRLLFGPGLGKGAHRLRVDLAVALDVEAGPELVHVALVLEVDTESPEFLAADTGSVLRRPLRVFRLALQPRAPIGQLIVGYLFEAPGRTDELRRQITELDLRTVLQLQLLPQSRLVAVEPGGRARLKERLATDLPRTLDVELLVPRAHEGAEPCLQQPRQLPPPAPPLLGRPPGGGAELALLGPQRPAGPGLAAALLGLLGQPREVVLGLLARVRAEYFHGRVVVHGGHGHHASAVRVQELEQHALVPGHAHLVAEGVELLQGHERAFRRAPVPEGLRDRAEALAAALHESPQRDRRERL